MPRTSDAQTAPPSTLTAMHNVARLVAAAGAVLTGIALSGCTLPIDPVRPDATSPAAAAAASVAATEPAACQDEFSADLRWDPDREVPVTAVVQLTNGGARRCDLTGFPGGVEFLADGHPLTVSYDQGEQADGFDRAGTTVTVDPGASAYVWIWVDRGEPEAGAPPCEFPAATTELALTLPGATVPVTAPAEIEVCTDERMLRYGPVDSEPRVAALGF